MTFTSYQILVQRELLKARLNNVVAKLPTRPNHITPWRWEAMYKQWKKQR